MWVRFIADFDFKPKLAVTIAYKAGTVANVTNACAERAIALGRAVKDVKANKAEEAKAKPAAEAKPAEPVVPDPEPADLLPPAAADELVEGETDGFVRHSTS